jgi:hypothetical protein
MVKRTQSVPANWRKPNWLGLFAAKFDATSASRKASPETGCRNGLAGDFPAPNAPGIWQHTDREGERTSFRVMDQNGELYAKVRRLAVPVQNLPGLWIRIE